jgi:hypothetical protein
LNDKNLELTQSVDRLTKVIQEKITEIERYKSLCSNLELELKEKVEECKKYQ